MPEEEKNWREALKEGDSVEAIKIDPEQKGARTWSSGKVKEKIDNRLKITFDHDSKMSDRSLSLYSKELAQYSASDCDSPRL